MRLTPQQRYYYLKKKQNPTLPCCSGSQQKQLLTEHPLPSSFNFSYPLFSALLKEPPLFSSLNVLLCPLWGRTPHFYPTKCGAYPFLQCAGLWKAQAPCKGTRSCPSETICWSHRQLARQSKGLERGVEGPLWPGAHGGIVARARLERGAGHR